MPTSLTLIPIILPTGPGECAVLAHPFRSGTPPRTAATVRFGSVRQAVDEWPLFAHSGRLGRGEADIADRGLGRLSWAERDRWPNGRNRLGSGCPRRGTRTRSSGRAAPSSLFFCRSSGGGGAQF